VPVEWWIHSVYSKSALPPEPWTSGYRCSSGEDIHAFVQDYILEGIAPFTLLILENNTFIELVWDGFKRHVKALPTDIPQIWSSVTLYPPEVRAWRKKFLRNGLLNMKNLTANHHGLSLFEKRG
jgi:hypothetical protein